MKKIIQKSLLFLVFFGLASCSSSKPAIETKIITKEVVKTIRDTVVKIAQDSSSYQALIDCRNGKALIKQVVKAEPGRILKSPKVRLDDNKLSIDCEARSQEAVLHYINTHQTQSITHTIPVEVNKLTFWQTFQIVGFKVFAFILTAYLAVMYLKKKL